MAQTRLASKLLFVVLAAAILVTAYYSFENSSQSETRLQQCNALPGGCPSSLSDGFSQIADGDLLVGIVCVVLASIAVAAAFWPKQDGKPAPEDEDPIDPRELAPIATGLPEDVPPDIDEERLNFLLQRYDRDLDLQMQSRDRLFTQANVLFGAAVSVIGGLLAAELFLPQKLNPLFATIALVAFGGSAFSTGFPLLTALGQRKLHPITNVGQMRQPAKELKWGLAKSLLAVFEVNEHESNQAAEAYAIGILIFVVGLGLAAVSVLLQ